MGRYKGKITHSFSTNPNRPTFDKTLERAQVIYIKSLLEKMTAKEQEEFIRIAKEAKLMS